MVHDVKSWEAWDAWCHALSNAMQDTWTVSLPVLLMSKKNLLYKLWSLVTLYKVGEQKSK